MYFKMAKNILNIFLSIWILSLLSFEKYIISRFEFHIGYQLIENKDILSIGKSHFSLLSSIFQTPCLSLPCSAFLLSIACVLYTFERESLPYAMIDASNRMHGRSYCITRFWTLGYMANSSLQPLTLS